MQCPSHQRRISVSVAGVGPCTCYVCMYACVVNVNLLAMRIFPSTVTLNHSLARSCFERADEDDFGNGQRMSNDAAPLLPSLRPCRNQDECTATSLSGALGD